MNNFFNYISSRRRNSDYSALCWLLAWANPNYVSLPMHQLGKSFVAFLLDRAARNMPNIETIEIYSRSIAENICCVINHNLVILITDTSDLTYGWTRKKLYADGFNDSQIISFYIQTNKEYDYQSIMNNDAVFIQRGVLLEFFCNFTELRNSNAIFDDYITYLESAQERYSSYLNLPLNQWNSESWAGFYNDIKRRLGSGKWQNISEFNWCWLDGGNSQQYLQLSQENLSFVIQVKDKASRIKLRNEYSNKLLNAAEKNSFPIVSPSHKERGEYMTMAVLDGEYRICDETGLLRMEKTIVFLQKLTVFFKTYQNP